VNRLLYSKIHWVYYVANRLQHWVKYIQSTLGLLRRKLLTSSIYGLLERRQVCADMKLQESVCTLLEGYVGSKGKRQTKSLLAAGDCITRAATSTWWNWEDVSRPFFWRRSEEYCHHIRDGIPLWYRGDPPIQVGSQRKEKDPEVQKNMGIKLMTVFARQYFEYGLILSLTSFFSVPK
jgi:hypothetical protein